MPHIATLTLNPTVDVAYEIDRLFHTRKMRTRSEFHNPGGGGINVARVFSRLGGKASSYYLAGGATGDALDGLLDLHHLVHSRIRIAGQTRIASAVLELESGKEFRFVPPGPAIQPAEWQACLALLGNTQCDFMVLSGSLPPGVPDDFYGQVAALMRRRDIPVVLDSSGSGLRGCLDEGGIFLVKPSIGELRQLTGLALSNPDDIANAAMAIVRAGQAAHVAVTMGRDGAILASTAGQLYLPAAPIEAKSAVGAGDSFLAAMLFAIAIDWDMNAAFRFGIAAGAAAVMSPGHDLAQPNDIRRLYQQVAQKP